MDHKAATISHAMHTFLARRRLLKVAGGAAGLAALGPAIHPGLSVAAQQNPTELSVGGTVPAAPGYDLPIAEPGTVSLRVATSDNGYAPRSFTLGLEVWAEIEKRTGITIEWEVTPSAQYNDVMSVRIGAGSDLPDVLSLTTSINPVGAGENNIALPLNDLIEQHAPNIKAFLDEFPEIRRLITAPDGEIYALPSVVTDAAYADPMGILYREDWLTQLGIPEPTTLDEWYDTLKRFKTDILEANGVADTAPMMGGNGNLFGAILQFGHALGLHPLYSQGWYVDDDGNVQYEWIDERFKELVAWFNMLHSENLIDPRFHESTKEDRTQLITTNNVGVDADFINRAQEWDTTQAQSGVTDAHWVIAIPPVSEQYPDPYYELYGPLSGWYCLTPNAGNPEIAIKWMDYVWASDEGNTLVSYGLEGITYTVGEDDQLQFTEWVTDNPEGLDPNSALRYYGAMPYFMWIRANSGPLSEMAWDITRINPNAQANAEKVGPYLVPAFPNILPTSEESDETSGILADLNTYREETILRLVLGQDDLDSGWEEYVATMEGLGVTRLVEIKQEQYDRYSSS
ncbi:MAG: extracellular solute-binding protein [Chloroflexia bacterium]|nr:extracellular solute-binding protein [Chloroflexia bacterium]